MAYISVEHLQGPYAAQDYPLPFKFIFEAGLDEICFIRDSELSLTRAFPKDKPLPKNWVLPPNTTWPEHPSYSWGQYSQYLQKKPNLVLFAHVNERQNSAKIVAERLKKFSSAIHSYDEIFVFFHFNQYTFEYNCFDIMSEVTNFLAATGKKITYLGIDEAYEIFARTDFNFLDITNNMSYYHSAYSQMLLGWAFNDLDCPLVDKLDYVCTQFHGLNTKNLSDEQKTFFASCLPK
jgi:hypothetical protein